MSPVVTLRSFLPPARVDGVPWEIAKAEEAPAIAGPWTERQQFALAPLDADPANPQLRDFTITAATLLEGYWRIRWVDGVGNTALSDPISVGGGPGYPSRAELVDESETDELKTMSPTEQEALYVTSIRAVEDYCGQAFTLVDKTVSIDGQGGTELYLPERLEALTDAVLDGSGLTALDLVLSDDHDRLTVRRDVGWSYYERALWDANTLTFPSGKDTVHITGSWGWPLVPDAVKLAIRLDMEDQAIADTHQLSENFRVFRTQGVTQFSQGGLRVQMGNRPQFSERVLRLLDSGYVWVPAVGQLV